MPRNIFRRLFRRGVQPNNNNTAEEANVPTEEVSLRSEHDPNFRLGKFKIRYYEDRTETLESVSQPGQFVGLGPKIPPGVGYYITTYLMELIKNGDKKSECHFEMEKLGENSVRFAYIEGYTRYFLSYNRGRYCRFLPQMVSTTWHSGSPELKPSFPLSYHNWKIKKRETSKDRAMRLTPIIHILSSQEEQQEERECPCCLRKFGSSRRIEVMTECKHHMCMKCIETICKITPPANKGTCALCRAPILLSNLRRVVLKTTPPGDQSLAHNLNK